MDLPFADYLLAENLIHSSFTLKQNISSKFKLAKAKVPLYSLNKSN